MISDQPDPKAGERTYYAQIGEAGAEHVRGKPFGDARRGYYLADMGALLTMIDPPPRRILDLGCGAGWTSRFLAQSGYTVMGVDISPEAIALAEAVVPESLRERLVFRVGDYEENREPGAFDYVLFHDALHHVAVSAETGGQLRAGPQELDVVGTGTVTVLRIRRFR